MEVETIRKWMTTLLTLLFVLTWTTIASAHVTVWPKESPAGGYERYTIRVPNEREVPTVKVRVELPEGATYTAWMPVAGWAVRPCWSRWRR